MTSYFHNGTSKGDAIEAPYGAELFANLMQTLYHPQYNCVIWDDDYNDLEVIETVAGLREVTVRSGKALVQGVAYLNTADYDIQLDTNTSEYARIDAIILRLTRCDVNEVRLTYKIGIPSPYPLPPTIESDELVLATVYVPSGFTTCDQEHIYDQRKFAYNSDHVRHFFTDNVAVNSEFIAFSQLPYNSYPALYGSEPPDYWDEVGSASFDAVTKPAQQQRGRAIEIIADAASEGMSVDLLTTEGTAKMFTLKFLLKVDSGICRVTWNGSDHFYYPSLDYQEITLRESLNGYQTLTIQSSVDGAATFTVGQVTLTQGYIGFPFIETRETLLFNNGGNQPFRRFAAQSTGNTTLYVLDQEVWDGGAYATIEDRVPGIKAVLVQLGVTDTGSAGAANVYAELLYVAGAEWVKNIVGSIVNSANRETNGIILVEPVGTDGVDYDYRLHVEASGAGTMTVYIYYVGIVV